jgi:hypothetical protein
MSDIAKWNGIAVAGIAKWNGIAVAGIGKLNGFAWPSGGGGYRADTLAYQTRVEADSGVVVSLDDIDADYQLIGDNSLSLSTDILFWGSSQAGVKKDGSDYVSVLYDLSDNDNDGVQSTATTYPQWVDSKQNSKASIQFDGSNDFLELSGSNALFDFGTGDFEIFAVWRPTAWSANKAPFSNSIYSGSWAGLHFEEVNGNGKIMICCTTGELGSSTALSTGTAYIMDSWRASGTANIKLNAGTTASNGQSGNVSINQNFLLGKNPDATYPRAVNMELMDFVVIGKALSSTQRGNLLGYFNTKWAVY